VLSFFRFWPVFTGEKTRIAPEQFFPATEKAPSEQTNRAGGGEGAESSDNDAGLRRHANTKRGKTVFSLPQAAMYNSASGKSEAGIEVAC
jgi:hypothetical protein